MDGLEPGRVVFTVLYRQGGKRVVFGGLTFFEVFEDFLEGSFGGLVMIVLVKVQVNVEARERGPALFKGRTMDSECWF